jgi:hypothetical protein
MKVLEFRTFDEKRAITPTWVMGFTSKWQALIFMLFTAMLITYIKGRTPALIVLERGSAMTRATFVIF